MKKILTLILIAAAIFSLAACSSNTSSDVKSNTNQKSQAISTSANNDNKTVSGGFISKNYSDKNELYAFVKSYLDYKKPSMEALEAKKSEFSDSVSLLAGGDWTVDIPVKPLEELRNLEKSGSSWNGTAGVYNYEVTKSGDNYTFKFTHTMLNQVTEGSCDIKAGTLQMVVQSANVTQKYQVKALGSGSYLRLWSEKSNILEKTRAHYTYFKGNDAAVGQEETTNPKDLLSSDYSDHTYVENNEAWVKFIGGKTSDFAGVIE